MRAGSAPSLLRMSCYLHVLVAHKQDGVWAPVSVMGTGKYLSSGLLWAAFALGTGPAAGWSASSACWSTELGRAASPVHNSKDKQSSCSISEIADYLILMQSNSSATRTTKSRGMRVSMPTQRCYTVCVIEAALGLMHLWLMSDKQDSSCRRLLILCDAW